MWKSLFAIVVFSLSSSGVLAGDYWPFPENAVYNYENDSGDLLEVAYGTKGRIVSHYSDGGPWGGGVYQVSDMYSENGEGDIFLNYTEGYLEGAIDPDYYRSLGEAFSIVDLPYEEGKTWLSVYDSNCCYGSCMAIGGGTWGPEVTVSVPFGDLVAVELSWTKITGCIEYPQTGSFFLHKEIGPVIMPGGYKLVSIEGIVGLRQETWGTLKAIHR